jgi:hypothetical protein
VRRKRLVTSGAIVGLKYTNDEPWASEEGEEGDLSELK